MKPILCEASAPLTPCQGLPDEAPLTVEWRGQAKQAAEQAEKEREEAWRFVPRWRGVALHPHSLGRDNLWRQMMRQDAPLEQTWGLQRLEAAQAVKLLYLLASPAEQILGAEIPQLVEQAEAWGDEHVTRAEVSTALDLMRRLHRHAWIVRARIKASSRGEAGAVPCFEASYTGLLAAALPSITLPQAEWEISLPRGWSLIHALWIRKGLRCAWLDGRGNKASRWMAEWRKRRGI